MVKKLQNGDKWVNGAEMSKIVLNLVKLCNMGVKFIKIEQN